MPSVNEAPELLGLLSARNAFRMLEESNDGFLLLDPDDRITYLNRRAGVLLGAGAHYGARLCDLFDEPELRQCTGTARHNTAASVEIERGETWLRLNFRTLDNDLLVVLTDVTEARRRALKRHLLDAIMTYVPEGITIANAPDMSIFMESQFGQTIAGRPSGSTPEQWRLFNPGSLEPAPYEELPLFRATRLGEVVLNEEWKVRRPDGTEVNILCNAAPIRDENGTITHGIAAWHDVSDLHRVTQDLQQAHEQLRQRTEELELVMDTVPVAIWVSHDPECAHIAGNATANHFYEADPSDNVSAGPASLTDDSYGPRRFFNTEGRELSAAELPMQWAAAQNQDVHNVELHVLRPSGNKMTMLGSAAPLRDEKGNVRGCVGAFLDITQRKQLEQEIVELNKDLERRVAERTASLEKRNDELQQFAFIASHDLQEPLRKVRFFADLIKQECADALSDEGKSYLDKVDRAAERMSKLLKDMLSFSRISVEHRQPTAVSVQAVVRYVLEDLDRLIAQTGARIDVDAACEVLADENQLRQLLNHLVMNAVKFQPAGRKPQVRISTTHRDDRCRIEVSDNGIGLDLKYADRIFQPFQRLHGRGEYPGTGMGLAICRRIVERHRGTIRVESTPGQGSRFIIELPVGHPESNLLTPEQNN